MPSKNTARQYKEGGIYHIYNRGINKQKIFVDDKDYATFLFYLKLYLDNPENLKSLDPQKRKYLARKNYNSTVELLCYCLMPNHYHLLLKQTGELDLSGFMRSLMINYSMYFNDRHKRVGPLFQGKYKAALVEEDEYLLHLSRYIHLNPLAKVRNLGKGVRYNLKKAEDYKYSSYSVYSGKKKISWVRPKFILDFFDENKKQKDKNEFLYKKYREFVEDTEQESEEILKDIILEEN